ncbi:MAG: ABC transporter ATP-binding protein [Pseudolabrys sp.]|nr:ABC transporter ATP-binding protein [Pseudolabrys sp.]
MNNAAGVHDIKTDESAAMRATGFNQSREERELAVPDYVSIAGVRKIYNPGPAEIEAVSSVSLRITSGDFVSIIGPSGCGKSTLLMMVAGLENPTEGTITISGRPVLKPSDETGIMFQDSTLLPWKTALENVLFPIGIQGRMSALFKERAIELLNTVGLGKFIDKRPAELSGGMKQRVAICRALIQDPSLLLMDEPFSALDAISRDDLGELLLNLWQKTHKTALFVTHSIREAVFLSDRVIVMAPRPSRIIADVKIPFGRPRNTAVQETVEYAKLCASLRAQIGSQHA